jgi:hypothetical protein
LTFEIVSGNIHQGGFMKSVTILRVSSIFALITQCDRANANCEDAPVKNFRDGINQAIRDAKKCIPTHLLEICVKENIAKRKALNLKFEQDKIKACRKSR